jgi:malto-oligosyltrehalose synthase/4-alpha-glucanotransferase
MNNLKATYRIQFHKDFTLQQLEEILPYLQELGISTLYASPIFKALPGSTHGYDILEPNVINPEIGTEQELRAISRKLDAAGIQWLQDIVPNHMTFDPRNPWLNDVLQEGPHSHYASFFDIDWYNKTAGPRLMVPFIGSSAEEAIQHDELKLDLNEDRLVFRHYDTTWPVRRQSYKTAFDGLKDPGLQQALTAIADPVEIPSWALWDDLLKKEETKNILKKYIEEINQDKELLLKIEAEQHYRLCRWNETDERINYRRFFIVNALICLNIQHEDVMREHHRLVFRLLKDGIFQGLRIDHIDGLSRPALYIERLREMAGKDTAIVVEKILEPGEELPPWPVEGNTGYDFLSFVNNLLTHATAEKDLTKFYRSLVRDHRPFEEKVAEKKSYILFEHMKGELENLFRLFLSLELVEKKTVDELRDEDLRKAIGAFLVHCPVYRFYGTVFPLEDEEALAVQETFNRARRTEPKLRRALSILEEIFLHRPHYADEELCERTAQFYSRCMQFSGPLMAKGVEDTLMYTDHRFIAHNEVGDSPGAFGQTTSDFHEAMRLRQARWPFSLNATSTHDTKRGEDVRARLQVLTDLSTEWLEAVRSWQHMNAGLKRSGKPHVNDEYFIYQTLIGTYPMPGQQDDHLPQRLEEYLQKALREAKTNSSWSAPDEAYENAAKNFTTALLNTDTDFYRSFQSLLSRIADHGIINSLVQVLLKFICPGVPDVYQGCELWDLSLVDPDNRRPVDYTQRQRLLEETKTSGLAALWKDRYAGGIKLWLVQSLFQLRKKHPILFSEGVYEPLQVEGIYKDHIIAFARKYGQDTFIVAAALHTALLAGDPLQIDWQDTAIVLPQEGASTWKHQLQTGVEPHGKRLSASKLFAGLPLAVLQGCKASGNERGAGILLPLSSLPSAFGIGDMGPEAKAFAHFLHRSGQKYWQLLPLNPTGKEQGNSPYSSISSRAGNVLFISPELLARDGLLDPQTLSQQQLPNDGKTDYESATLLRSFLFDQAWEEWQSRKDEKAQNQFEKFQQNEKEWLDDLSLYIILKDEQQGLPWYEWEEPLRLRDKQRLQQEREKHKDMLEKVKWLQFLFARQWAELKLEVNNLGIKFIGDLPFYVSHDAADVWTHPHLFALDGSGQMTGVAGVPPDAFSDDGQLWGMPVFNWAAMKKENYAWWIARLRRNIALFDLVRLDHFRAFASYWEVPAGATTAREGTWKPGPGADFFHAVEKSLGHLPFVAEDLGEIDEAVYQLRDQFNLPGMKVLQFAFDGNAPHSPHIPHNHAPGFFVYTGTHDNNTTRGWFLRDADDVARAELEAYAGRALSSAEVSQVMSRMAYGSVAHTAILPLQDVLNLDERARINVPASAQHNWVWRLLPDQVSPLAEELLRKWTNIYHRE